MKKIFSLLIIQVFISGLFVSAQKFEVKKGTFDFLKNQKTLKVSYEYSNMGVGKFEKEDDYIAEKVANYNAKEAGSGDKWKEGWVADRAGRYEPKFELLFNDVGASKPLLCSKTPTDAEYEMIIHTIFTEPGFNIGITRKPAYIDVVVTFKNITSGEEVAVLAINNCPGRDAMGFDYDTGFRIEEGYAKLGKSLASFLLKKLK